MNQWLELVQIDGNIIFIDEPDIIVWQFNSTGCNSVKSLYIVVNDEV
jgi:hypothetical protein